MAAHTLNESVRAEIERARLARRGGANIAAAAHRASVVAGRICDDNRRLRGQLAFARDKLSRCLASPAVAGET